MMLAGSLRWANFGPMIPNAERQQYSQHEANLALILAKGSDAIREITRSSSELSKYSNYF